MSMRKRVRESSSLVSIKRAITPGQRVPVADYLHSLKSDPTLQNALDASAWACVDAMHDAYTQGVLDRRGLVDGLEEGAQRAAPPPPPPSLLPLSFFFLASTFGSAASQGKVRTHVAAARRGGSGHLLSCLLTRLLALLHSLCSHRQEEARVGPTRACHKAASSLSAREVVPEQAAFQRHPPRCRGPAACVLGEQRIERHARHAWRRRGQPHSPRASPPFPRARAALFLGDHNPTNSAGSGASGSRLPLRGCRVRGRQLPAAQSLHRARRGTCRPSPRLLRRLRVRGRRAVQDVQALAHAAEDCSHARTPERHAECPGVVVEHGGGVGRVGRECLSSHPRRHVLPYWRGGFGALLGSFGPPRPVHTLFSRTQGRDSMHAACGCLSRWHAVLSHQTRTRRPADRRAGGFWGRRADPCAAVYVRIFSCIVSSSRPFSDSVRLRRQWTHLQRPVSVYVYVWLLWASCLVSACICTWSFFRYL